jgi:hypothetical protein
MIRTRLRRSSTKQAIQFGRRLTATFRRYKFRRAQTRTGRGFWRTPPSSAYCVDLRRRPPSNPHHLVHRHHRFQVRVPGSAYPVSEAPPALATQTAAASAAASDARKAAFVQTSHNLDTHEVTRMATLFVRAFLLIPVGVPEPEAPLIWYPVLSSRNHQTFHRHACFICCDAAARQHTSTVPCHSG